jgi:hypothetical protein
MHIEGGDSGASVFTDTYLTVENSGNTRIAILSGTTGTGGIKFGDSGLNRQGGIDYIHSSDAMTFATTNAERMRIDSSGRVGIGLTNPSDYYAKELVVSAADEGGITLVGGTGHRNYILWADGSSGSSEYMGIVGYDHADDHMEFATGSTERLRIDSSGNLLVGTTTTNTQSSSGGTNTGTWINSAGIVNVGSNSNAAAYLNRQSTDGDIAVFRKDGTAVGSIGTLVDDLSIGNLDTGLIFQGAGDRISPFNPSTNTYRDAAIDLGYSTRRFKDLYLSGGVYLGGTGSANKLDDYEEGSGNVSVGASGSGSVTIASGGLYQYTKVGNIVHFQFEFQVTSVSGASGAIQVALPFTAYRYAAGSLRTYNATFSGTSPFIETVPSQNVLYFYSNSSGNVTQAIMSTGYYYGEVTYTVS